MLSLCDALCISNSCFTKHARGNRSLAFSNMSRSLQRFLKVHTKQHRFVESFKRSDIQLRIISIHCDLVMFCRKTCVLRFGKNENKMDLVTLCYFIDRIIVTTVNRNVRIYKKKNIVGMLFHT